MIARSPTSCGVRCSVFSLTTGWPLSTLANDHRGRNLYEPGDKPANQTGEAMRKADIANQVCEKVGVSKTEAMELVEYVLDCMRGVLQNGEPVKIAGFGNILVRNKGQRKGRNPRTGEEIAITPRRVVTFRASQIFKKYVNS